MGKVGYYPPTNGGIERNLSIKSPLIREEISIFCIDLDQSVERKHHLERYRPIRGQDASSWKILSNQRPSSIFSSNLGQWEMRKEKEKLIWSKVNYALYSIKSTQKIVQEKYFDKKIIFKKKYSAKTSYQNLLLTKITVFQL